MIMFMKSKAVAISLLALLLIPAAFAALSGCREDMEAATERGPFDHPDGVYPGESDLED